MNVKSKPKFNYLLLLIFAIALFSRLWQFGIIPGDINQDEAFAGYEAWAIMNFGMDSSLHPYPVYLTAWGSGMNALESYLMMPFIALFGLKVWVIRLPQLIVGLISIYAAYILGKKSGGERMGLAFSFLLAVCPWHVLLCRWGLESNLAPGFLLFGMCFFALAMEDSRYMTLSALMYGLALYTYATIWSVLPVIILLELIYAFACGRLKADRWLLLSFVILAVSALPLLLFMAVNYGVIDEIKLPWLSVPKMLVMRSGEISLKNIPENLANLKKILLSRSDGLIWNSPEKFGAMYILSFALVPIGLVSGAVRLRRETASPTMLMFIQLVGGFILCCLVSVNLNRMNILLMPLVYFEALGLDEITGLLGRRAGAVIAAVYIVLFCQFETYYFTDYAARVSVDFTCGFEEAFSRAIPMQGDVYISPEVHYPKVLFYAQIPPEQFNDEVVYNYYPAAYLSARSIGRYRFDPDEHDPAPGVYILRRWYDVSAFAAQGYKIEQYNDYYLIYK